MSVQFNNELISHIPTAGSNEWLHQVANNIIANRVSKLDESRFFPTLPASKNECFTCSFFCSDNTSM
jgi:hypothetical protein